MLADVVSGLQASAERHTVLLAQSPYRAASNDRLMGDWRPKGQSPDEMLLEQGLDSIGQSPLDRIRKRTRDLVRNNSWSAGLKHALVANVIGPGYSPQCRLKADRLGLSEQQAAAFQDAAEEAWSAFVQESDSCLQCSFHEQAEQALGTVLDGGDALAVFHVRDDKRRAIGVSVELVEAELIRTPRRLAADRQVVGGVRKGRYGVHRSYYVHSEFPDDLYRLPISNANDRYRVIQSHDEDGRIKASHLARIDRPGQTRGLPWMHVVVPQFDHLDMWFDSEMWAARIGACFSVFLERMDVPLSQQAVEGVGSVASSAKELELEPGRVHELGVGQKVSTFTPNRPSNTFDAFISRIVGTIASSLGLPALFATLDFSNVNYSSARAAILAARTTFEGWQRFMIQRLYQPAWNRVVEKAWLDGRIPTPVGVSPAHMRSPEWMRVEWAVPRYGWIDPSVEVDAYTRAIEAGLMTRAQVAAELGYDWEAQIAQMQVEKTAYADVLGGSQTAALNGAQIQSASAIIASVARGEIPRDSGIGQLRHLLGLNKELAEAAMGSAGTPRFTPQVEDSAA